MYKYIVYLFVCLGGYLWYKIAIHFVQEEFMTRHLLGFLAMLMCFGFATCLPSLESSFTEFKSEVHSSSVEKVQEEAYVTRNLGISVDKFIKEFRAISGRNISTGKNTITWQGSITELVAGNNAIRLEQNRNEIEIKSVLLIAIPNSVDAATDAMIDSGSIMRVLEPNMGKEERFEIFQGLVDEAKRTQEQAMYQSGNIRYHLSLDKVLGMWFGADVL